MIRIKTIKKARRGPRLKSLLPALVLGRSGFRHDIHPLAVLVKPDLTVHQREERPIAARADVLAGLEFRATLPDNDTACRDEFAAVRFHTEPLADAVAPVTNAALTFFMCHTERLELRVES